jgi:hypothetical protein
MESRRGCAGLAGFVGVIRCDVEGDEVMHETK